jgi:dipeptidyl aminopeptidase/acylaminoacyl peptidase
MKKGAGPIPIEDLFYTRSVSGPSWSPDGSAVVFTTNTTGRLNLWKVPVQGGYPVQLAQSDDRQVGAAWSPDGKLIVYAQDKGGGEVYDLFGIPAAGGAPVNLTKTDDVTETNPVFSPTGTLLAFASKLRSRASSDVAVLELGKGAPPRLLTHEAEADRTWSPVAWSRDGAYLFANRENVGGTDADVYRIAVATGAADRLTPHEGSAVIAAAAVSPDGRTVLVTTDEKGGVPQAALLDVATKARTPLTTSLWEVRPTDFSPDGKSLTYVVNEDGRARTVLYDLASKTHFDLPLPEGLTSPAGSPRAFSPSGGSLLLSHQSSRRPSDLWIYDLGTKKARPLTISSIASVDPEQIPSSTLVHYPSFDGTVISAFLSLPLNLERDGTHPGVVLPHGGPTGQTLDTFNPTVAALASRGYVVIAPNVRGSTGYGLPFQKANHQDLGGGDLEDEVFAAKFLVETGYVDAKKIGITGGSYGGFMTLMAIGKAPDAFAAAVEQFGIINWYSMLEHEDPRLQEYEKSLLGDPVKDKAAYDACSPITYIRKAKAPLLVLQGDNDIRVPKEEATQVVDILKGEGRTVDAHYYPNEGHGFVKRENRIDAIERTIAWFDKYLKGASAAP